MVTLVQPPEAQQPALQISESIARSAIIAPSVHEEQAPPRVPELAEAASIGTGARTPKQSAKDVSSPSSSRIVDWEIWGKHGEEGESEKRGGVRVFDSCV